jgi:hypothetical protein
MEQAQTYAGAGPAVCDGCAQAAFELRAMDGGRLCGTCAEISVRVDQRLVNVSSNDPVVCDACADRVDFDARIAVITRECGGAVLCERCASSSKGDPS